MPVETSYTVRQATLDDLETVTDLMSDLNALHAEHNPETMRAAAPEAAYVTSILEDPDRASFLAFDDDSPVGLIQIEIKEAPDIAITVLRTYAYMAGLIVTPSHRGKGVGTILTDHAEQWAASRGATKMQLGVWEWNTGAFNFYEKSGYETFSRRMWKDL